MSEELNKAVEETAMAIVMFQITHPDLKPEMVDINVAFQTVVNIVKGE